MSSLGLGHHNPQNLRISPQCMTTMSSQMGMTNMRISSPHSNGPIPSQNLTTINTLHSSSNSIQTNSITNMPITSPQNLSMSPSQDIHVSPSSAGIRMSTSSCGSPPLAQQLLNNLVKPTSPEKTGNLENIDVNDGIHLNNKDSALNMTMNNSDMRSNSIATLRNKAKEHLETINKSLTIV